MVAIIDYGVGNLFSLRCSLEYIGAECAVTGDGEAIRRADRIILPGVGAFGDAAAKLRSRGLDQVVVEEAARGKPLLGICLGMQLLYEASREYGDHKGLGLVKGTVDSLSGALGDLPLKVPQIGWNSLEITRDIPLLKYTREGDCVYYVHSFFAGVTEDTAASSQYGPVRVTGVVCRDNVYGTQFHPEKSGGVGLEILRAFGEA